MSYEDIEDWFEAGYSLWRKLNPDLKEKGSKNNYGIR